MGFDAGLDPNDDLWIGGNGRSNTQNVGDDTPLVGLDQRVRAEATATTGVCSVAYSPQMIGDACSSDSDCGETDVLGGPVLNVGLCGPPADDSVFSICGDPDNSFQSSVDEFFGRCYFESGRGEADSFLVRRCGLKPMIPVSGIVRTDAVA